MVLKAEELVPHGQKAIVFFTRGAHFRYDAKGSGSSGYWVAGEDSLADVDVVIIYLRREHTGANQVFRGQYTGWQASPRAGRKTILFSGLEDQGGTPSNWVEFGGSVWSPSFYIKY